MGRTWVYGVLFIAALTLVLYALTAVAAPLEASSLSAGVGEDGPAAGVGPTNTAQGGNVTELDISARTQSDNWQGYWGQVTGWIVLEDDSGDQFYNWSVLTPSGEVYATRNTTTPAFGGMACGGMASEDTELGLTGEDDSVASTYTENAAGAYTIAGNSVDCSGSLNTEHAWQDDGSDFAGEMALLNDGANRWVYMALISNDANGFEGSAVDFQLMVPTTNSGTADYYFYAELG